jgi:hypothetical protein
MKNPLLKLFTLFALVSFSGCGHVGHDDHHGHDHHHNEIMTTVVLTLTPADGGTPIVATWADPEGDGSPVIDDIALSDGKTYAVAVQFLNELENPVEDVTTEIGDEAGEHQIFFTGTAVESAANTPNAAAVVEQTYDDADGEGFPLGLSNTFNAIATGTGVLTVTMRHMPPVNDTPVKTGTLADIVNSGSMSDLPGSTDISVDFNISVAVHDEDEHSNE